MVLPIIEWHVRNLTGAHFAKKKEKRKECDKLASFNGMENKYIIIIVMVKCVSLKTLFFSLSISLWHVFSMYNGYWMMMHKSKSEERLWRCWFIFFSSLYSLWLKKLPLAMSGFFFFFLKLWREIKTFFSFELIINIKSNFFFTSSSKNLHWFTATQLAMPIITHLLQHSHRTRRSECAVLAKWI